MLQKLLERFLRHVRIALREMTEVEFQSWRSQTIQRYQQDFMKARAITETEAIQLAQSIFIEGLPQGRQTPRQFLMVWVDSRSDLPIGSVWWGIQGAPENRQAQIFDFHFKPTWDHPKIFQRCFSQLEETILQNKLRKIGIQLFGHDRNRYHRVRRQGYRNQSYVLEKNLSS